MKKLTKRAQGAAAFLIVIITVLIVLYILFLPPVEREKILGEQTTDKGLPSSGQVPSEGIIPTNIIVSKPIGRLSYLPEREFEHNVPSVNIALKTEGKVVKDVSSLYFSRTLFSKKNEIIEFSLNDIENTKNVFLAFNVVEGAGRMVISLNGKEVFNREVGTRNVEPITLPKEWLKENNILQFETDSPGIFFWRKNFYDLSSIKIIADIINRDSQKSKNLFVVSESELYNMANAALRFTPICDQTKVRKLEVAINNNVLYSAIPDCGSPARIELEPSYFRSGQNTIEFTTEEGNMLLDQIAVTTFLASAEYPVIYFETVPELYQDILEDRTRTIMEISFPDDISLKELTLFINGHIERISQYEKVFQMDISEYIELSTNSIELVPEETLDVTKVTVFWESE